MTLGYSTAVNDRITRRAAERDRTPAERAAETRPDRIRSTGNVTSVTSDLADLIGANVVVNLRRSDVANLIAALNGTADDDERARAGIIARDLAAATYPDDADLAEYVTRNI